MKTIGVIAALAIVAPARALADAPAHPDGAATLHAGPTVGGAIASYLGAGVVVGGVFSVGSAGRIGLAPRVALFPSATSHLEVAVPLAFTYAGGVDGTIRPGFMIAGGPIADHAVARWVYGGELAVGPLVSFPIGGRDELVVTLPLAAVLIGEDAAAHETTVLDSGGAAAPSVPVVWNGYAGGVSIGLNATLLWGW